MQLIVSLRECAAGVRSSTVTQHASSCSDPTRSPTTQTSMASSGIEKAVATNWRSSVLICAYLGGRVRVRVGVGVRVRVGVGVRVGVRVHGPGSRVQVRAQN